MGYSLGYNYRLLLSTILIYPLFVNNFAKLIFLLTLPIQWNQRSKVNLVLCCQYWQSNLSHSLCCGLFHCTSHKLWSNLTITFYFFLFWKVNTYCIRQIDLCDDPHQHSIIYIIHFGQIQIIVCNCEFRNTNLNDHILVFDFFE